MKKYFMMRILTTLPLLLGVTFISFCLINFMPTDPAEVVLRINQTPTITEIEIAQIRLA